MWIFLGLGGLLCLSGLGFVLSVDLWVLVWTVIKMITVLLPLGLGALFLILAERKVMGYMQDRIGPNRVGVLGVLQTAADGLKFLLKEIIVPEEADRTMFLLAPIISLVPAFAIWSVIPVTDDWVFADIDAGLLFVLAISSLGALGVLLAGWASNSKYALFSAIRAMAQMISYEIAMGFALLGVMMMVGSMNLTRIVWFQQGGVWHWLIWPLFPVFVVYCICAVAEVNRAPFDVVEGESEIVAGYQVEYSGFAFAMFFVAEYCNMILVSAVASLVFVGGWLSPFEAIPLLSWLTAWVPGPCWLLLKTCGFLYTMIWVRSTFPRYRYDQVMMMGWKVLIPLTFVWLLGLGLALRGQWL